MKIQTLQDMFLHTLKDIHYAETKVVKSLPKMIEASQNDDLKDVLKLHLKESEGQIDRIKQVFKHVGEKPGSTPCDAIDGILKEGETMLEDTRGTPMCDLGVIATAQAIAHYEIVRYRSLVMWAGALEMKDAAELLQMSLNEERQADEKFMAFGVQVQKETADAA